MPNGHAVDFGGVIIDVGSRAKFNLLISCFGSLNEGFAGILVDRTRRGEVEGKCGGTERDQVRCGYQGFGVTVIRLRRLSLKAQMN
jgi:hypothetical protein